LLSDRSGIDHRCPLRRVLCYEYFVPRVLCSARECDCPLRGTFLASRRALSQKRPPLLVDRCPLISTRRAFLAGRRTLTNERRRLFSNRRARTVVSLPHTASRRPRAVDRRRMF